MKWLDHTHRQKLMEGHILQMINSDKQNSKHACMCSGIYPGLRSDSHIMYGHIKLQKTHQGLILSLWCRVAAFLLIALMHEHLHQLSEL